MKYHILQSKPNAKFRIQITIKEIMAICMCSILDVKYEIETTWFGYDLSLFHIFIIFRRNSFSLIEDQVLCNAINHNDFKLMIWMKSLTYSGSWAIFTLKNGSEQYSGIRIDVN